MVNLKWRYWVFLSVVSGTFIFCLCTGHPFLWASIGLLIFLFSIAINAITNEVLFSILVIFSLVCIHVSVILGSYVAMAIALLFWVSLITQWWKNRLYQDVEQRWQNLINQDDYNFIPMKRKPEGKVNWIKEGF